MTGNKQNYYTRSHTRFHHVNLKELVLQALYTQLILYLYYFLYYINLQVLVTSYWYGISQCP
jgi:hypothetical protein